MTTAPTAAPAPLKRVAGTAPVANATPAPADGVTPGAAPVAKRGGGLTRAAFDFRTAVNAQGQPCFVERDGKVLLTACPANYDFRKNKALEKTDFTTDKEGEAGFYEFKARGAELMRDIYVTAAANYRTQAENVRKYGNSEHRKLADKAISVSNELRAMVEQMRKEGMDVSEFEKMLAPKA